MNLRLHHIGIAVRDIDRAVEDHRRRLGCRPVGELFHDPMQTALIQFLSVPGDSVLIELVAPDGPKSLLARAVRTGVGINHLCYSTDDIEAACESLREDGMVVFKDPTPAVAFGGRRIAWLMGEEWYLTELVERGSAARPSGGIP
jgi:methylmalonyl-CoA/ethylmalonyl-CoA epimerase